jgi:alkanesulfonate monooxygenase SsuD/methylene tetrahydromethanopterin reductase-like flavin-dependent oxidoreductase (luciferase family)
MTLTASPMDTMADFDISPSPVRVGIALRSEVWLDSPEDLVRIRAHDLRDAARKTAATREDRPDVDVLVDIEVVIARDARTARAIVRESDVHHAGDTLLYVGTPAGLAGLIADIQALGIAEGAVLIPLAGVGVADLIRLEVLPELHRMAEATADIRKSRPA